MHQQQQRAGLYVYIVMFFPAVQIAAFFEAEEAFARSGAVGDRQQSSVFWVITYPSLIFTNLMANGISSTQVRSNLFYDVVLVDRGE